MAKMMGMCPPGRGFNGRYRLFFIYNLWFYDPESVNPWPGMYWLGLTDIAQEGVWLDNYGNEVDMSTMSATIDNHHQYDSADRIHGQLEDKKLQNRKRSMPPANGVHIPLLDFSKLHQPQQPSQARGASKA